MLNRRRNSPRPSECDDSKAEARAAENFEKIRIWFWCPGVWVPTVFRMVKLGATLKKQLSKIIGDLGNC